MGKSSNSIEKDGQREEIRGRNILLHMVSI